MSVQNIQTTVKICYNCKKEIPYDTRILRTETCPWCRLDLHVCMNCKHHDPSRYNECMMPGTERVRERDRANHCSEFVFRYVAPSEDRKKDAAIKNLNSLFKF